MGVWTVAWVRVVGETILCKSNTNFRFIHNRDPNNDNMTYGDSSNQITAGLHLKYTTKLNQTQEIALTRKLTIWSNNIKNMGNLLFYSVFKAVKERIMARQLCFLQLR